MYQVGAPKTQEFDMSKKLPQIAKANQVYSQSNTNKLEYNIGRQKIEQLKKIHGKLLNIPKSEEDENKPECHPGLSVFQRDLKQYYRPFSAIFDKLTPDMIKNE